MARDTTQDTSLRWSSQLSVAPPWRAPKLPGDKITLPQSALEQLLAAAPMSAVTSQNPPARTASFDPFNPHTFAAESRARQQFEVRQQQLPHPLTFRIVNPRNGRFIYAGIREFSAQDNEVVLSPLLREALEINDTEFTHINGPARDEEDEIGSELSADQLPLDPAVTVHVTQLPKGSYVRLRPLEAGYDPEDWKALLERYLRDNFTTLTVGELLVVSGTRNESFRFLVDKVYPEAEGICIVDTDLEVDIVALTEEQARETLQKRLEKASRVPGTQSGSSIGGTLGVGETVVAQVVPGEYVDYELRDWNRQDTIEIELTASDDADAYLFISPLSSHQRSRPRADEHVLGDFSFQSTKRLRLQPTNVALEGAEALYISVHAYALSGSEPQPPVQYNLRIAENSSHTESEAEHEAESHEPGDVRCQNCQQWVPQRTLVLHENFCLRNNVLCRQCRNVFQKRSPEWQNHWHCAHDSAYGNDVSSKSRHDAIFHVEYSCPSCHVRTDGLPSLAQHRTTVCPGKLILCQFCHLLVPQKGDSDPDLHDPEVVLSGLTPHELVDGGRTTECHLCNKIIRLRDMKTHLRHHDLERLSRPAPRICLNQNCGRTLSNGGSESLGLCNICFGPLYVDTYDPEGKALRRRIERRYLSQMMSGCGKPWCQNQYCKNGKQKRTGTSSGTTSAAEILKLTRPIIDAVNVQPDVPNTAPFYFCTDETGQRRRILAEMLAAESKADGKAYGLAWCVAGAEAAGGDLEKTREWLAKWAPTLGEGLP